MKQKLKRFVGVILGIAFGFGLGYLRLPFIDGIHSFWAGVAFCLGGIAVLYTLSLLLGFQFLSLGLVTKSPKRWVILLIFLIGGVSIGILSPSKKDKLENQIANQEKLIQLQQAKLDSISSDRNYIFIHDILGEIEEDMKVDSSHSIRKENIERLAHFVNGLTPYSYIENNVISSEKWSPEKGKVLQAIIGLRLDSASLKKLFERISFAHADLSEMVLDSFNLEGIDLRNARLKSVKMNRVSFQNANLSNSDFRKGRFTNCIFNSADISKSSGSWSLFKQCNLNRMKANGTQLSSSEFIDCSLNSTSLKWSDFKNALIDQSELLKADFFEAKMDQAQILKSNLDSCRLRGAFLANVVFDSTTINGSEVGDNWFESLESWKVKGRERIMKGKLKEMKNSSPKSKKFRYSAK